MRSAAPLPCLFDVVKSQNVAGQWPQQGTKSCRMGRNSAHLSNGRLSRGSEGLLKGSEGLPERSEGLPKGSEGQPEGPEGLSEQSEGLPEGSKGLPEGPEGLPGGPGGGRTYGRTDGRTDGRNFSPFYRTSSPVGAAAQKLKILIHCSSSSYWTDPKNLGGPIDLPSSVRPSGWIPLEPLHSF